MEPIKAASISSTHITPNDLILVERHGDHAPLRLIHPCIPRMVPTENGCLVYVCQHQFAFNHALKQLKLFGFSVAFRILYKTAYEHGFNHIDIQRNAPVTSMLPVVSRLPTNTGQLINNGFLHAQRIHKKQLDALLNQGQAASND